MHERDSGGGPGDDRNHERERGRALLDECLPELLAKPDVSMGRLFGSDGVFVRGKLFAFVSTAGELVVKLPEARIDELRLDNMVMRGRPMREWASVPQSVGVARWRTLVDEAHSYVELITP